MNSNHSNHSNHDSSIQLFVFTLDGHRYALHLSVVERVFQVVEVTPLPKAPDIVLGLVNIQGRIIPVVNIRKRFQLPERDLKLSDHLIVANTPRRAVALVADSVVGILETPAGGIVASEHILPGLEYVEGLVKLEDGMLLIHNLDRFFSLDEEQSLCEAMKTG